MFQIKWTSKAANEKANALKFWIEKNKSLVYSRKIMRESKNSLNLLKENPYRGQEVFDIPGIRYVVVLRKFCIFYRIKGDFNRNCFFLGRSQKPQ
jgi:hypothetical protein